MSNRAYTLHYHVADGTEYVVSEDGMPPIASGKDRAILSALLARALRLLGEQEDRDSTPLPMKGWRDERTGLVSGGLITNDLVTGR